MVPGRHDQGRILAAGRLNAALDGDVAGAAHLLVIAFEVGAAEDGGELGAGEHIPLSQHHASPLIPHFRQRGETPERIQKGETQIKFR